MYAAAQVAPAPAPRDTLRVCADPNNLPFSNAKEEGFENRIATLIANAMHATVAYTWWAERRGFIRNTLRAHRCDLVTGIPERDDMVLTTTPYYRSTYVFITRADRGLHIHSLNDPRLHQLRIGMHLIGDDGNALPPGLSLSRRGIIRNVRGYSIYGDYSKPNPPAALIDAVAKGDIDVAIAWGPLAGYFAQREPVRLEITPVTPAIDGPAAHFEFAIGMGVRHGDTAFKARIERVLHDKHAEIQRILTAYGVPLVERDGRVVLGSDTHGLCAVKPAEAACE
ncbi:MAG TPA: substrate-binding domain-containing protein [Gemmatimonadaceae bacterium]|nr:substrate-binding domain-containing protein [Gemmatimonadaceae bacterium]